MVEIVDMFIQAAQGLRAMHQMGYVHCDIKPNNILRNDEGQVKVIDFGQSVKVGTVKERIQGTPDYIAPEQVDRRPVSLQTDIFNLGASLYWALTGKTIPTLYTVNKKGDNSFLLARPIETPERPEPAVPRPLSNLVMECVATSPSKRPARHGRSDPAAGAGQAHPAERSLGQPVQPDRLSGRAFDSNQIQSSRPPRRQRRQEEKKEFRNS